MKEAKRMVTWSRGIGSKGQAESQGRVEPDREMGWGWKSGGLGGGICVTWEGLGMEVEAHPAGKVQCLFS